MIYSENILLCITIPLAMLLLFIKGNVRRFIISLLIGMFTCLFSAYIGGFLEYASGFGAEDTSIFLSPIVEEVLKFLPVLFYYFTFEPGEDELMITALGIGAGFATFENSCYILSSGAYSLGYTLIRGAAVGVMHLASMVILSAGINFLKRHKALSFAGFMGALTLAMTVHALYNLWVSKEGVTSVIGYLFPITCVLVMYFILFTRRKEKNMDLGE